MKQQQKFQLQFFLWAPLNSFFLQGFPQSTEKKVFFTERGLRTCTFISALLFIGSLLLPGFSMAFEVETHEGLTGKAIETVAADLNTYLVENLGLEQGLNTSVNGKTAEEWMVEGSNFEDGTFGLSPRPFNHFHDPIHDDGLTPAPIIADSAIDWSLSGVREQFDGEYSWNDAREYYFKALTSPTKTERDENWGKTFRALGQVMHLLQDQASPAHVRNDPHLSIGPFPDVDGLHTYMKNRSVDNYASSGIGPDPSILEEVGATRSEPLTNLFDHNVYIGSDPTLSLGTQAGLAEYTNANFFSDDRIAGQFGTESPFYRSYPHPSRADLFPEPIPSVYLVLPRLGAGPNARVAKLTGNQVYSTFNLSHLQYDLIDELWLDNEVYEAQARNLIPRAVGYSAAVLDYFFRRTQFRLEPSDHLFEVTGTFTPGSPDCGPPIDPQAFEGALLVRIPIPSDLNFSAGTAYIYYEKKSDGSRVLAEQFDFPRPFPPFGQELSFGVAIPHADVPDPVRWYVVLEGMAGPGVQEKRAILANTDQAAWMHFCLG